MLMSAHQPLRELENAAEFVARHIGIDAAAEQPGWTEAAGLPSPEIGYSTATVLGGRLFLFGGAVESEPAFWQGVPVLEKMELDVLGTASGPLFVKNNLADLNLSMASLHVTGTLAELHQMSVVKVHVVPAAETTQGASSANANAPPPLLVIDSSVSVDSD